MRHAGGGYPPRLVSRLHRGRLRRHARHLTNKTTPWQRQEAWHGSRCATAMARTKAMLRGRRWGCWVKSSMSATALRTSKVHVGRNARPSGPGSPSLALPALQRPETGAPRHATRFDMLRKRMKSGGGRRGVPGRLFTLSEFVIPGLERGGDATAGRIVTDKVGGTCDLIAPMSQAPSFLGVRVAPPAGPSRGLVVARAQAVPIPAQFKTVRAAGPRRSLQPSQAATFLERGSASAVGASSLRMSHICLPCRVCLDGTCSACARAIPSGLRECAGDAQGRPGAAQGRTGRGEDCGGHYPPRLCPQGVGLSGSARATHRVPPAPTPTHPDCPAEADGGGCRGRRGWQGGGRDLGDEASAGDHGPVRPLRHRVHRRGGQRAAPPPHPRGRLHRGHAEVGRERGRHPADAAGRHARPGAGDGGVGRDGGRGAAAERRQGEARHGGGRGRRLGDQGEPGHCRRLCVASAAAWERASRQTPTRARRTSRWSSRWATGSCTSSTPGIPSKRRTGRSTWRCGRTTSSARPRAMSRSLKSTISLHSKPLSGGVIARLRAFSRFGNPRVAKFD